MPQHEMIKSAIDEATTILEALELEGRWEEAQEARLIIENMTV